MNTSTNKKVNAKFEAATAKLGTVIEQLIALDNEGWDAEELDIMAQQYLKGRSNADSFIGFSGVMQELDECGLTAETA